MKWKQENSQLKPSFPAWFFPTASNGITGFMDTTRDCVFCRIVQRQLPAEILFENDRVISILDINPIHHGHALVIPKKHCIDFLSIPEDDLHDVLHVTQLVARAIVAGLKLEGFNIFSNNGRIAGQSVFHFHMHITPRYANDNIRFVLQLKSYSDGALAEYGENIREHIRKQRMEKENR